MFIQTESTPNPNALKFLPGIDVNLAEPIFFNNVEEAKLKSALAVKIFQIDNIEAIFYGISFITVTKTDNANWDIIKPEILMVIMDHIVAGFPIFDKEQDFSDRSINTEGMSDIEKQIVEIIETRVRPSVAMDGGDITYQGFRKGTVFLQLKGACSGCPSSSVTLKNGIESMLQHFVPEVKNVEAVEEGAE